MDGREAVAGTASTRSITGSTPRGPERRARLGMSTPGRDCAAPVTLTAGTKLQIRLISYLRSLPGGTPCPGLVVLLYDAA